jgi:hypothetical protein
MFSDSMVPSDARVVRACYRRWPPLPTSDNPGSGVKFMVPASVAPRWRDVAMDGGRSPGPDAAGLSARALAAPGCQRPEARARAYPRSLSHGARP